MIFLTNALALVFLLIIVFSFFYFDDKIIYDRSWILCILI